MVTVVVARPSSAVAAVTLRGMRAGQVQAGSGAGVLAGIASEVAMPTIASEAPLGSRGALAGHVQVRGGGVHGAVATGSWT